MSDAILPPSAIGTEPPRSLESTDDREALVRFDLADTARRVNLRCVALMIGSLTARGAWLTVSADFASARTLAGSDNRYMLAAAEDAADHMAAGNIDLAVSRLAKCCGISDAEWLTQTRAERAKAGAL